MPSVSCLLKIQTNKSKTIYRHTYYQDVPSLKYAEKLMITKTKLQEKKNVYCFRPLMCGQTSRLTIRARAAIQHWQGTVVFARTGFWRIRKGRVNTGQILLWSFVMSPGDSNLLPGNNPLIIASWKFTLNAHIITDRIQQSLKIVLKKINKIPSFKVTCL